MSLNHPFATAQIAYRQDRIRADFQSRSGRRGDRAVRTDRSRASRRRYFRFALNP